MSLGEKIRQVLSEEAKIQDISGADEGKKAEEHLKQADYPGADTGDKTPVKLDGADPVELDPKDPGESAASKETQTTPLKGHGAGEEGPFKNVPQQVKLEDIDLGPIFGETELSEDFKVKATGLFETAVIARVNHEVAKVQEELKEAYEAEVLEVKAELQLEMAASLDNYLTAFAERFIEENQIAVDSGLRVEIAEGFMQKLHQVFAESYIEVPEAKIDIVESVIKQNEELEVIAEEQVAQIAALETELNSLKKDKVFSELAESMTDVEIDKIKQLSEGVEFQDYDTFKEKLNVIKESFFTKASKVSPERVLVENALSNDGFKNEPAKDSQVSKYATFLSGNK